MSQERLSRLFMVSIEKEMLVYIYIYLKYKNLIGNSYLKKQ